MPSPKRITENVKSHEGLQLAREFDPEKIVGFPTNTLKSLKQWHFSPDELLMWIRSVAHGLSTGKRHSVVLPVPQWMQQLTECTDAAGFIRHDLRPRTLRIWWMYACLGEATENFDKFSWFNQVYESLPDTEDEFFAEVIGAINACDADSAKIKKWYGLDDETSAPKIASCRSEATYRYNDPWRYHPEDRLALLELLPSLSGIGGGFYPLA